MELIINNNWVNDNHYQLDKFYKLLMPFYLQRDSVIQFIAQYIES